MAKVLLTAFLNSKCNPLVFILGFNPSVSPYCIRQAAGSSGCWGAGRAEAASAAQPALPVQLGVRLHARNRFGARRGRQQHVRVRGILLVTSRATPFSTSPTFPEDSGCVRGSQPGSWLLFSSPQGDLELSSQDWGRFLGEPALPGDRNGLY